MGIPIDPGRLGALDRQPEQPVCGIQSLTSGFCPRRQNGLERGYSAEQRPAQPGDSGHRAELCRTEQVGGTGGTLARGTRRRAPDRAAGRRAHQGGRGQPDHAEHSRARASPRGTGGTTWPRNAGSAPYPFSTRGHGALRRARGRRESPRAPPPSWSRAARVRRGGRNASFAKYPTAAATRTAAARTTRRRFESFIRREPPAGSRAGRGCRGARAASHRRPGRPARCA